MSAHTEAHPINIDDVRRQAQIFTIGRFGINEWPAMEELINRESGFDPKNINPSSGACGLFQANPCSKLHCEFSDIVCQLRWGADYIQRNYKNSPTLALQHHNIYNSY